MKELSIGKALRTGFYQRQIGIVYWIYSWSTFHLVDQESEGIPKPILDFVIDLDQDNSQFGTSNLID